MSSIYIRQRRLRDFTECAQMLGRVHETDGYPVKWPANVRNFLEPTDELKAWVAVDDDAVVGYLVLTHGDTEVRELADAAVPLDVPVVGVARFFVHPDMQGAGIGARLLSAAAAEAAARGRELILSVVDTGDNSAVAIYEHLRWRLIASLTLDWPTKNAAPYVMRYYLGPR